MDNRRANQRFYLGLRAVVLVDEWLSYWTLILLWALGLPLWVQAAAVVLAAFGNAVAYYNLCVAESWLLPGGGPPSLIRARRAPRPRTHAPRRVLKGAV